jgi:hypothetical protein
MITLANPISVTPPPIGDKTFEPIEFSKIDYSVTYDSTLSVATAFIKGVNRTMLLWEGPDYIAAGQFTDIDTDKRILQLLGSDPAKTLENLLINIQPYVYTPANIPTVPPQDAAVKGA